MRKVVELSKKDDAALLMGIAYGDLLFTEYYNSNYLSNPVLCKMKGQEVRMPLKPDGEPDAKRLREIIEGNRGLLKIIRKDVDGGFYRLPPAKGNDPYVRELVFDD